MKKKISDLTHLLAIAVGVDPREFDAGVERVMITIGKGIYWSEEFDKAARDLEKRIDDEFTLYSNASYHQPTPDEEENDTIDN